MNQARFEWSPDFWRGWRESSNPYRGYKSGLDRRLVLKSLELRDAGLRLEGMAGDVIVATVPLAAGPIRFPPESISSFVCKYDEWATDRFAWLAYEVWFRGVKAIPPCTS